MTSLLKSFYINTHEPNLDVSCLKLLYQAVYKYFLSSSCIDYSDNLETPSYFVSLLWCIKLPKTVLGQVHPFISNFTYKFEMSTIITLLSI